MSDFTVYSNDNDVIVITRDRFNELLKYEKFVKTMQVIIDFDDKAVDSIVKKSDHVIKKKREKDERGKRREGN